MATKTKIASKSSKTATKGKTSKAAQAAKSMLAAKSAKKSPAKTQAAKDLKAGQAKQAAKKSAGKTVTASTREWVYKFEKTASKTHVYSREVATDDGYRTAKQYLSIADYPKAPKRVTVTVRVG